MSKTEEERPYPSLWVEEDEVEKAVERGDAGFLVACLQEGREEVAMHERHVLAWQQEGLKGLGVKLVKRLDRHRRLRSFNAPDLVLQKDEGLLMLAIGEFVGAAEPETFTLRLYKEE